MEGRSWSNGCLVGSSSVIFVCMIVSNTSDLYVDGKPGIFAETEFTSTKTIYNMI